MKYKPITIDYTEDLYNMGKSKLVFKRNTTDKLSVKGILSEDCTTITYTDDKDAEQDIKVSDLLLAFKNCAIEFGVSLKSENDLELITSDED